jgi:hypothetical protein
MCAIRLCPNRVGGPPQATLQTCWSDALSGSCISFTEQDFVDSPNPCKRDHSGRVGLPRRVLGAAGHGIDLARLESLQQRSCRRRILSQT